MSTERYSEGSDQPGASAEDHPVTIIFESGETWKAKGVARYLGVEWLYVDDAVHPQRAGDRDYGSGILCSDNVSFIRSENVQTQSDGSEHRLYAGSASDCYLAELANGLAEIQRDIHESESAIANSELQLRP